MAAIIRELTMNKTFIFACEHDRYGLPNVNTMFLRAGSSIAPETLLSHVSRSRKSKMADVKPERHVPFLRTW